MKQFIASFLFSLISLASFAQINFFGEAKPIRAINTPYDENFISLHPNSNALVITRKNYPGNVGEQYNPADLWASFRDSSWTRPANINVHPNQAVTPLGFINSGQYFLYSTTQEKPGSYEGNVWLSTVDGNKLTNPRKLDLPHFRNKSPHQSGSISKDGRYMVLSMEGTTTFGVEDLYVLFLQSDGTWSAPRNLGYRVNTAFQEYSPFLASDNETLIFATNGRGGYGSFDLFITQRVDDTWQNWTEPVNLGSLVNTEGAETSFVFNPGDRYAYFVSTTDSDGYGDIKQIQIEADIEESISDTTISIQVDAGSYKKIFTLKDTKTDEIIEGTLVINDSLMNAPYTYLFSELQDVYIEAKAAGYLEFDAVITASELDSQDLIIIPMVPLEVGTTVNLENVLFYQGTANFIEGSERELEKVVAMLKENPTLKIEIKGHTDNVGVPALNMALSEERVKVVIEYLISSGIEKSRLSGKGYGGTEPIASNESEESRRLNRRVEFTVIEN